jgi:Asp-tRNA(Asn)/Glu-tRNA(Gln) amidotransferase A subunit family amidase
VNASDARARIRELSHFNAFISVTAEDGDGPVVAVKDLVRVRGTVTTGGGAILPKVVDLDDAPVIARMRTCGCVVVGKANLHEWAFGVTSANPHYGTVLNPRDPTRIPGGSSGGSAAAVALRMCDWAVGSDTGGSIRIPAGLCGVVGFKPTVGTVAMEGVIPLSRTLDTLGPLAPDVLSAARALATMCDVPDLVPEAPRALGSLRLAVPAGWVSDLDDETDAAWRRVSAHVPEIPFPDLEQLSEVGRTILFAEAAAYHRRWLEADASRYGDDVRAHLQRGLGVSAVDYLHARDAQPALRTEMEEAMSDVDAVLLPATAVVAPRLATPEVREPLTRFTRAFNTTGHPVITLPAPGTILPVGIQVVGRWGRDAELVRIAWALERAWA